MDINLDTRQGVKPTAGGLRAPDLYSGQRKTFEAERAANNELGKAFANVGKTVAYCGELLTRYDQETLARNFKEDSMFYNIRLAEKMALGKEALRYVGDDSQSNDPRIQQLKAVARDMGVSSRPTNRDEFQRSFNQMREWAKRQIADEMKTGSLVVRNADRWEKELNQMFEVQSANAMLSATNEWMVEQDRLSMQIFDASIDWIVRNGTIDELNRAEKDHISDFPERKELVTTKLNAARSAIAVRDTSSLIEQQLDNFGKYALQIVESSYGDVKESHGSEGMSKEQLKDVFHSKYFSTTSVDKERFVKTVLDYISGNRNLSQNDKDKLSENVDEMFDHAQKTALAEFERQNIALQKQHTEKIKASLSRSVDDINSDPTFARIAPDSSMLNPDDEDDMAYSYVDYSDKTRANFLSCYSELCSLEKGNAEFGDNVVELLEKARKRGISREQYMTLFNFAQGLCKGTVKASTMLRSAAQNEILTQINSAYGTNFKKLEEAIGDERTIPMVDIMLSGLAQLSYTAENHEALMNSVKGMFSSALLARDKQKAIESAAQTWATLRGAGTPTTGEAIAYREKIQGEIEMVEEMRKREERKKQEIKKAAETATYSGVGVKHPTGRSVLY